MEYFRALKKHLKERDRMSNEIDFFYFGRRGRGTRTRSAATELGK